MLQIGFFCLSKFFCIATKNWVQYEKKIFSQKKKDDADSL